MESLSALLRINEDKFQPMSIGEYGGPPFKPDARSIGVFVLGNNNIAISHNEIVLLNIFVLY